MHRNNVGRDDKDCLQSLKNSPNSSTSARRGRNRNGSNLHDCLRVHKFNYILKFVSLSRGVRKRQGNGAQKTASGLRRRALQSVPATSPTNSNLSYLRRCRGLASLHGIRLPFSKLGLSQTSSASRPWVGRLALNTFALYKGRKVRNTTPTAIPNT